MEWVARHTKVTPLYVAFVACQRADCECAAIPAVRRRLSTYLHEQWGGALPPTVREGNRFLSLTELMDLSSEKKAALVNSIPEEFNNAGWRHCKAAGCCFWDHSTASLQRHRHLLHHDVPPKRLYDKFYLCNFQLPRPLGPTGLPEGPYLYCQEDFTTDKELNAHKAAAGHKKEKKKKAAPAPALDQAATAPAPSAAPPAAVAPPQPAIVLAPAPPPPAIVPIPAFDIAPAPGRGSKRGRQEDVEEEDDGSDDRDEQEYEELEGEDDHPQRQTKRHRVDDAVPSRVEVRYTVHGVQRFYCGTVLRPSYSAPRKFYINFDNGDKEVRTLAVDSSTWQPCPHVDGGCAHLWCKGGFVENAASSSSPSDNSDSD